MLILSCMSICFSWYYIYVCTCRRARTPRFMRGRNMRRNKPKCHTAFHTKTKHHCGRMDLLGVVIQWRNRPLFVDCITKSLLIHQLGLEGVDVNREPERHKGILSSLCGPSLGAYQIWNDRETVKDPEKRVEGLMSLSRIKGNVMVITL